MQKLNCGFAACNLNSPGRQTVWSRHPPCKYRPRRFADEISGLAPDNKGLLIHLLHDIWNHDFNFRNNSLSVRSQCLTVGSQFEGEFRSSSRRSVTSCVTLNIKIYDFDLVSVWDLALRDKWSALQWVRKNCTLAV